MTPATENLIQLDGNVSVGTSVDQDAFDESDDSGARNSDDNDDKLSDSEYETEDEAFSDPIPANLFPRAEDDVTPGQPIELDLNMKDNLSSYLPLCLLLNARSIYNKSDNLSEMLQEIGPDICLISETFEREKSRLNTAIKSRNFKSISYYRKNRAAGGGCAIVYNGNRFSVSELNITAPAEVENCWALFVPNTKDDRTARVRRIAVGSYYVSPRSKHKQETIDHIIDTIQELRAKYDNDVSFLIGGDFNRTPINDVLDSYGALKQIISVPTRNTATLELLLTDLHTMFHPPTTIPPLQVDPGRKGKDGDHEVVVLAPISNKHFKIERKKKTIITRPLPQSNMDLFENAINFNDWDDIFKDKTLDEKVESFHQFYGLTSMTFFLKKSQRCQTLIENGCLRN